MAGTYWMLVSSPENFEHAREMGFSVLGMKHRHLRKAEKVAPGDRVVFYAVGQMAFAGTFTVTSTFFESHEPLFKSKKEGEDYPYRFDVRPDVILPVNAFVPAVALLPDLDFVKKWPEQHWHLAFQGNVHVLNAKDFETIERALERENARARPSALAKLS